MQDEDQDEGLSDEEAEMVRELTDKYDDDFNEGEEVPDAMATTPASSRPTTPGPTEKK